MAWTLYISAQASRDIDAIWEYGYDTFGLQIADDYDALIKQALFDIRENPHRPGVALVPDRDGMYAYHLRYANQRAPGNIKTPRHAVIYFLIGDQTVAVASISRLIRQHHIKNLSRDTIIDEMNNDD
ncbi:MAG: type II toxin-antitoxin system RelE/ParE family toxin [Pseudomonadota bacterium]